jgi:hypothetical protein
VPVVVLDHLSETQRRAYILADNKLAMNAGWDEKMLASELRELETDGVDLALIGFSDEELEALLEDGDAPPEDVTDEVPEPPAQPVTQPGDVWLIGAHRLICGDCREGDSRHRPEGREHPPRRRGGAERRELGEHPPAGVAYREGVAGRGLPESEWSAPA